MDFSDLPEWAEEALQKHEIELENVPNARAILKMIIGLNAMASSNPSTATKLLMNQPDIVKFLAQRKENQGSEVIVIDDDDENNSVQSVPRKRVANPPPADKAAKKKTSDAISINSDASAATNVAKQTAAAVKNDNIDIRILDSTPPPHAMIMNELVCFGVLHVKFGADVQHSILHSSIGNSPSIEVNIMAEPTHQPNIYRLRVDSKQQLKIGSLEADKCRILSPLLKHLRIDGSISRPQNMTDVPMVHLTIYGVRSITHHVGRYLAHHKLFLNPLTAHIDVPYFNPHAALYQGNYGHGLVQTGQGSKTVDEVKSQIDSIYNTLTSAENLPEMEPDPRLITPLYPHQKQALHFMTKCEHPENNNGGGLWKKHGPKSFENLITGELTQGQPKFHKGGILADDMGLGKTIEVISVLLKSQNEGVEWAQKYKTLQEDMDLQINDHDPSLMPTKGTLIVCPLSTVSNWEDQINSHVRRGALSVYVYHGAARCQDPRVLSKFSVVLTTYNVLSLEYGKDLRNVKRNAPEIKSKIPVSMMNSILHKLCWFRVVLDEAHIIKDTNTGQAKAACALSADRKWCLTGTPIQNKLEDIYSLVNFLNVEPFCSKLSWTNYITKGMKLRAPSGGSIGVARLQTLMKAITLRRTKFSKIRGKPILSLPPRYDDIRYIKLDSTEQILYDRASAQAQKVFEGFEQEGSVMKHYVHLLELILKLRQICTHPLLCKNIEDLLKDDDEANEWTEQRATDVYNLLKETGDDNCGGCGAYVDGIEFTPQISNMCNVCSKSLFSQPNATCPVCSTALVKGDVITIVENDGNDEDIKKPVPVTFSKLNSSPSGAGASIVSSKVKELLADLAKVKAENMRIKEEGSKETPVKVVIFSQWTSMLDLLEKPILQGGLRIVRLDGRMTRTERNVSLDKFKRDPNVTVILISLKAGGVGLNLTTGSRVYIMEPYWNPAVEQQAVDRVHRLGQTKPVYTIRFVATGTIEDSIIEMQKKKTELAQVTFKEGETVDLSNFDQKRRIRRADFKKDKEAIQKQKLDDLRMLFNLHQKKT